MFVVNPVLAIDGYKTSHRPMYPQGTKLVYINFTPRSVKNMHPHAKKIVVFGIQYTMRYIHDLFKEHFFNKPKNEVIGEAKRVLSSYLGCDYDVSHLAALHELGYLPIRAKALPEGTIVDEKIPILTIHNTLPEFFWLPNYLETIISSLLWKPLHSASIAYAFKRILVNAALATDCKNVGFVDFQGHDFSARGMQHLDSAISSGLGFLTSFKGSDTVAAVQAAEYYYHTPDAAFSVPASEHSVMCAYGKEDEIEAFRRILRLFPTGPVSVVSDSFDLWKVCTEYVSILKEEILARDGRLVIRPDSGDPVDILCGTGLKSSNHPMEWRLNPDFDWNTVDRLPSEKGVIELLWDVFGGTTNDQGYKVLDSHIGAIYGDAITLDRMEEIIARLKAKGFASTNVVFGIGSYTMGYATRDSQGCAIKATYCEVEEEYSEEGVMSMMPLMRTQCREIFKDPVTDNGVKKSARGLVQVYLGEDGHHHLKDRCTWEEESKGDLEIVYMDGYMYNKQTLTEIREKLC
jgi:nicotinamide phosphoribosyltransferase